MSKKKNPKKSLREAISKRMEGTAEEVRLLDRKLERLRIESTLRENEWRFCAELLDILDEL